MKKTAIYGLLGLQLFTLMGVCFIAIRIYATEKSVKTTQESLINTVAFMDDLVKKRKVEEEMNRPLAIGEKAPDFSLVADNGNKISLDTYKGEPVLLVFTEPGCEYCELFFPVLNDYLTRENSIEVAVMHFNSTQEENKAYKEEFQLKATFLAASEQDLINYKARTTLKAVLVDEAGNIANVGEVFEIEDIETLIATAGLSENSDNSTSEEKAG